MYDVSMATSRINMNLPDTTKADLNDFVAAESGVTATEIVRRSIALYKFVKGELDSGHKLQIVDAEGKNPREIILLM